MAGMDYVRGDTMRLWSLHTYLHTYLPTCLLSYLLHLHLHLYSNPNPSPSPNLPLYIYISFFSIYIYIYIFSSQAGRQAGRAYGSSQLYVIIIILIPIHRSIDPSIVE